jgi:hypothetical protein
VEIMAASTASNEQGGQAPQKLLPEQTSEIEKKIQNHLFPIIFIFFGKVWPL